MEADIIRAQALFEEGDYSTACDIAIEILKEHKNIKEASLLAAKSFLFTVKDPTNQTDKDAFFSAIDIALDAAETIEDVQHIEQEILNIFPMWQRQAIPSHLASIQNSPTLNNYDKYIKNAPEYIKLKLLACMKIRGCAIVDAYCEEKGITKKQYVEKYAATEDDKISKEELSKWEFTTACEIFEAAKVKFIEEGSGSVEFVQTKFMSFGIPLIIAESLTATALNTESEELTPITKCKHLKKLAEIRDYKLNAVLIANGNPVSIFSNKREEQIEELEKTYEQICELDPEFVCPPLPDVEAKSLTTGSSSGGCYVATAVYGSYNCPEVWTLRRYRDDTLASTWYGRAFIRTYYKISPTLVKWFGNTKWFKNMWKPTLDRMVQKLNARGVADTPYNDRKY